MRNNEGKKNISGSLVNVAVFGITLCIAVMIIAVAILFGFKKEIRNKIVGFGGNIQIVNYDANSSYETQPVNRNQDFLPKLKQTSGVTHVQEFAIKAGIIKTKSDVQGVVLKGVGSDFDWAFFKKNLVEGSTFNVVDSAKSNSIIISKYLSNLLKLKVNDDFLVYFIPKQGASQEFPKARKFKISGIYETSVEEMDKIFVICDIGHIQKLNKWDENQVSGFEVYIKDFDDVDHMKEEVNDVVGYGMSENGSFLRVQSIKEKYPQIFDWLDLQDMNVVIILILMLAVSGFNMISGLLILILDRTNMIGILKALGASSKNVRQIFILESGFLIMKGLLWGNIFGIGLCLAQKYFGLFKLDAATYYLSQVPIDLNIWYLLALNIGTIVVTILMQILPSLIIARLSPAETIKYS